MTNPYKIYNHYLNQYGEVEGKALFLQYAYFMSEVDPFPESLQWDEIIREINNGEILKFET